MRERKHVRRHTYMRGKGAERKGRKRIPSKLPTVGTEPDVGLQLMNLEIMTQAEIKSWTLNQLSYPGALENCYFQAFILSQYLELWYYNFNHLFPYSNPNEEGKKNPRIISELRKVGWNLRAF